MKLSYMLTTAALLVLLLPITSQADHSGQIDRDDLDDEVVESFPVPVLLGVELSEVVPDYGAPRGGGTRSHEGQDFMVPRGTPIVTPTEAIVIGTGVWPGGGKYVQTANPGGETFRYMHLDEWADLDPGDQLSVGDYIGTVGDTGNAAPGQYHLHFETLDDDRQPQDPYSKLSGTFSYEERMEYLERVFRDRRDDEEYAVFLLDTFATDLRLAYAAGVDLPRAIEQVLDDRDQTDTFANLAKLEEELVRVQLQLQVALLREQLRQLSS